MPYVLDSLAFKKKKKTWCVPGNERANPDAPDEGETFWLLSIMQSFASLQKCFVSGF